MSNAFDEYVMERCEEIIATDKNCLIASAEASKASKAFFISLSPTQQKDYLKFESINEKRNSCHLSAIYKLAFIEGKK